MPLRCVGALERHVYTYGGASGLRKGSPRVENAPAIAGGMQASKKRWTRLITAPARTLHAAVE
jgi:hypothetical protein